MKRAILGICLLWLALLAPVHAQQQGDPFRCVVTVSTATSLTAVGGDCTATSRPGLSMNITDVLSATNAAGIAADSYNTLKYGTGTTCGTGTTVVWFAFTAAATQATVMDNSQTPLRLPPNVDLCWINTTAGSKAWVIRGFYAP